MISIAYAERMAEAQRTLVDAAGAVPDDVAQRLQSADKLGDQDRAAIVELARKALVSFVPKPDPAAAGPGQRAPQDKP